LTEAGIVHIFRPHLKPWVFLLVREIPLTPGTFFNILLSPFVLHRQGGFEMNLPTRVNSRFVLHLVGGFE
jgi:hypothetical protein